MRNSVTTPYYLISVKSSLQTFSPESGRGRLQEVVAYERV